MLTSYRIACAVAVMAFSGAIAASYLGWGLPNDATLRAGSAQSVRQGSIHGRHYMGGGPSFGK